MGGASEVREEALGGVATCRCFLELQLLRGGVALCWAGVPAGVSSSIGEASEGGGAAATVAYELGAEVCGIPVSSWEAIGGSVSMGVGGDSLVRLEIGGLAAVGGGPRKGRKLPSFLELAFFWPRAMVKEGSLPKKMGVWCEGQEVVWVTRCW